MVKDELNSIIRKEKESISKRKELEDVKLGFIGMITEGEKNLNYVDYKKNVEDLEIKALDNKIRIIKNIDKIEDDNERFILRERYLNGRKWDDITEEMFYSKRRVFEIHSDALKSYKEL